MSFSTGKSPRQSRATHGLQYRADIESARDAVVQDNPYIPVVSEDWFIDRVIPTTPPSMVDETLQDLEGESAIRQDGIIAGFNPVDNRSEAAMFRPLHTFCQRIDRSFAKRHQIESSLVPRYHPNHTPTSDNKADGSRPDIHWSRNVQLVPSGVEGWHDIVIAGQLKPDDNEISRQSNQRQIIWSAQQALRNDPRRMFFFGITIEFRNCRLWYFSRSHIMVTSGFDFTKNPRPLVKFLVGLSFFHGFPGAPTVNHTLPLEVHGYDQTMKRLDRGDSVQYAILVGNTWYETIRVLSDFRAESIRGRCTRVWEVFEQRAPEGPTYALKAAWVDRRNHSEGEIYLELMERMKTKQDPHATEDILQNHFLRLKGFSPTDQSVTTCQYLGLKELSLEDSIRTFQSNVTGSPLNIPPIPRGETRRPYYYNSSGNIISGPDGHTRDFHLVRPGKEDQYIPRRLDRSVWLDVGTTFDQCMSLREIFKYIRQVVQALRAMWLGAFAIHRDISPGNIIICDGQARLSDFESVTFYDPNQASEAGRIKTGTAQFMSIEVFNGSYEFRTQKPIMTHRSKNKATLYGAEYNEAPFMHNPFHDLESIWWLLVWTLFRLSPSQSTNLYDVAILEKKAEMFQVIFLPPFNLRHLAFKDPRFFADRLPTSSFPDTSLEVSCSDLAQFLYSHYQRVEASIPIAAETFGDMFPVFLDYIQDMDEDSQDHDSLTKVLDVYGTLKISA